jgi:hypothetical protein
VASKSSPCQLFGIEAAVGRCGEQCYFFLPLVGRGSHNWLPLQSFTPETISIELFPSQAGILVRETGKAICWQTGRENISMGW